MTALLDFAVAVGISLALRSNMYGGEVTTDAMGTLPLVLFPAFAVPLMIIVHMMIFQRLNAEARFASDSFDGTTGVAV